MIDNDLIWGTYRPVLDYTTVFEAMHECGARAIDTAPNYQGGNAEKALGKLPLDEFEIFGKVGYTSGDPKDEYLNTNNSRFCLDPEYIRARAYLSSEVLFPTGGKFACISLHNPEHLWDNTPEDRAQAAFSEAILALGELWKQGITASIGISSWSISPYSTRGKFVMECTTKLGLAEAFAYYMHPLNILRRELLDVSIKRSDANLTHISSAPLAGGQALQLLGAPFAKHFVGVSDPLTQCLMLAKYGGRKVCLGVGSPDHARQIPRLDSIPSLTHEDVTSLMTLLSTHE